MPQNIIDQAYQKALEVLERVSTSQGFRASGGEKGYHLVWTRDSMITLLCSCVLEEKALHETARKTLETLRSAQVANGWLPNNVDPKQQNPERLGPDGYDNCSWYVIGVAAYYRYTKDIEFLKKYWQSIKKAVAWLAYHESSQGLLYIGEAGDWQDILSVRGHGLYANVVYTLAVREGSYLAKELGYKDEAHVWRKKAEELAYGIDERLWLDPERFAKRLFHDQKIKYDWEHTYSQVLTRSVTLPYYLAFLSFRDAGSYFDTFGNCLAILTNISGPEKTDKILDYMEQVGIDYPYPSKSINPAIHIGDAQWRRYFLTLNLNLPHQYQNGGVWPFLGGFHILALLKAGRNQRAKKMLEKLAQANKLGNNEQWEFNEWLHGRTGRPAGKRWQAWSAALYVLAYKAVQEGTLPEVFQ